jgi:methylation protein EvaC|tara:strand:- start:385 stop:1542 length:1158 start_codon:yes stop_codon:yes gene_type:complete
MPIANAFLKKDDLKNPEFKFELAVGFCEKCTMVQLIDRVNKRVMFNENYAYFSSVSKTMEEHFKNFSAELNNRFLGNEENLLVVEIGCNDGIMLKNFNQEKIKSLGIEPSKNVADAAREKGLEVINNFFDESLAKEILKTKGNAKVIYAANVICHIESLHELAKGIKLLLKKDGIFVFEEPYIIDIIEKNAYDQIYDEHVFYFSATSLRNFFSMYDMEIFEVYNQSTHGGSMRYYVCNKGSYKITDSVYKCLENEEKNSLDKLETYNQFAKNVEKSKIMLVKLLKEIKSQGKSIVGYGASSKGTIVLNYCNIGNDMIEYITDTTPTKQGLYSPGMHIPIISPEEFYKNTPDYALLMVWNYAKEIKEKEKDKNVKFIVHIPYAKVI